MASKFIAVYNGMTIPFDSAEEFAVKYMGFRIDKNERGAYDVILNGYEVAHYSDEWTEAEVMSNFFRWFFRKYTFANLHFYTLIGKD